MNGILGGIIKMLAASTSPDPLSTAGSRGILGALANLQPAPSSAQADASYLPGSRAFMSPEPIGFQDGSPLSGVELVADKKTDKRNSELFDERAFGITPPPGSTVPKVGATLWAGPRPSPPALPAPQPQLPSAPGGLSSSSPGQAPNSPQLPRTPIGPAPAIEPEGGAGNRGGAGTVPRGVTSPTPIGETGQPTPPAPEWRQYEQEKGSQQTVLSTTYQGKEIMVRLDFPPAEHGIVDLKKYNWWKPGYMKPFLQGKVSEKFQIHKFKKNQTVDHRVIFKFSEQPPPWVVQALDQVGGTYVVDP